MLNTNDVKRPIYYRRFGEGPRALIVPNAIWLEDDFAGLVNDHSVVFYDPRGRGRSLEVPDKSKVTLESELEDLDTVIRECGLEQVVLFGWSYQGAVVAHYAVRRPDRVLRVIQSGPLAPRRVPHYVQALAAMQARLDMPAMAELMKAPVSDPVESCKAWGSVLLRAHFVDPAARSRSLAQPCQAPNEWPQNVMQYINGFMSSLGEWDWRPLATGYPGPVLTIHGEGDWNPIEGSREWQTSFPHARLAAIPAAGHFPWLEQGPAFFQCVNDFLGDADWSGWRWPALSTP